MSDKLPKTEEEWKQRLSPEQFRICRLKGTEPAFTGKYHDEKSDGTYHCVACDEPLFESSTKYDSGTGWPSFFQPIDPAHVATELDKSHGMIRLEVKCNRCGSHLGHVFEDGPQPTGKRFCINSAALELRKKQD